MSAPDLHKLTNTPGYGSAQATLMRAGLWDEYAGLPVAKYRVSVTYEIRENSTETYTVDARCEDEAEDLACKKAELGCDYDIEITDVEVQP